MGLSNSRLGSRSSRPRVNRCSSLSSFLLCGASSSRASYQMEVQRQNINEGQNHRVELSSVSVSSTRTGFSAPNTEIGANLGNCYEGGGLRSIGASNNSAFFPENNKEQISDGFGHNNESFSDSTQRPGSSGSLFIDQQSLDMDSVNVLANTNAVNGVDGSERNGASSSSSDAATIENRVGEVIGDGSSGSESRSSAQVSNLPQTYRPFAGNAIEEVQPSGLGFLVSNRERTRSDGSVLHVDVLSISSNVLSNNSAEGNNREARRNGGRMFWDAFSRRSSRRLIDSSTFVLSMDDNEDVGSRDEWVFGLSGDFFDDANGSDSGYLGSSRIQYSRERRRNSRSEVWERLRRGFDDGGRRNTFCPLGLHPDGTCSCESSLINEESSTRASISRIVMLAEALFEVLDEIHRQPVSLSLSMVSSPAPASIVDSFPLKSHSKIDKGKGSDDAAECYICLAEYEEGDKIRVLPCHHEYHMCCVDKWLKEIHGVCPLCRGDVREGLTDCSIVNSEIPSV